MRPMMAPRSLAPLEAGSGSWSPIASMMPVKVAVLVTLLSQFTCIHPNLRP